MTHRSGASGAENRPKPAAPGKLASPRRPALEPLLHLAPAIGPVSTGCSPLQPSAGGWPLLGPDSARIGPNARKWADQQLQQQQEQQPREASVLPGTVVVHSDAAAEAQQTRWNQWLEHGEHAAEQAAEPAAAAPAAAAALPPQATDSKSESAFGSAHSALGQSQAGSLAGSPAQAPRPPAAAALAARAAAVSGGSPALIDLRSSSEAEAEVPPAHSSLPASPSAAAAARLRLARGSRSDTGARFWAAADTPTASEAASDGGSEGADAVPELPVLQRQAQLPQGRHRRQPSLAGPVYMRPASHARLPSADMGPLQLGEYFSPLSRGLGQPPPAAASPAAAAAGRPGLAAAAVSQVTGARAGLQPQQGGGSSSSSLSRRAAMPGIPAHLRRGAADRPAALRRSLTGSRQSEDGSPEPSFPQQQQPAWQQQQQQQPPLQPVWQPEQPLLQQQQQPLPAWQRHSQAGALRRSQRTEASFTPLSDSVASWKAPKPPAAAERPPAAPEHLHAAAAAAAPERPASPLRPSQAAAGGGAAQPGWQQALQQGAGGGVAQQQATAPGLVSSPWQQQRPTTGGSSSSVGSLLAVPASPASLAVPSPAGLRGVTAQPSPAAGQGSSGLLRGLQAALGSKAQALRSASLAAAQERSPLAPIASGSSRGPAAAAVEYEAQAAGKGFAAQAPAALAAHSPAAAAVPQPAPVPLVSAAAAVPPPPPPPPPKGSLSAAAAKAQAGKRAPLPPPPPPKGGLCAAAKGPARAAAGPPPPPPPAKPPAAPGAGSGRGVSAAELAAGIAGLRKSTAAPPQQPARAAAGKGGGLASITAGDLASARGRLRGVTPPQSRHNRRASSRRSDAAPADGMVASILRKAQDLRARFAPESTAGGDSDHSDWED